MKLPPVEYEAPTTVADAVDLLAEYLDEASVLAGGQSLIPLLALRLARPAVLIDINGVAELSGVSAAAGWVSDGMMATGNRRVRPPGLLRFSGTTSTAQCAPCSSGTGCGVVGQGPATYCAGSWATVVGVAADDGLPLEVEFECPQAAATATVTASAVAIRSR